jgi:hypothetical protein
MAEIATDIAEGADVIIIKPALPYLDIVRRARDAHDIPLIAYNVSGEYAMVKAAAQMGWIDERRVTLEILTSIKRAGADRVITYHAKEASRLAARGHESSASSRQLAAIGEEGTTMNETTHANGTDDTVVATGRWPHGRGNVSTSSSPSSRSRRSGGGSTC